MKIACGEPRGLFQAVLIEYFIQASLEFKLKSPTEGRIDLQLSTSFKGFSRLRNVWFWVSVS